MFIASNIFTFLSLQSLKENWFYGHYTELKMSMSFLQCLQAISKNLRGKANIQIHGYPFNIYKVSILSMSSTKTKHKTINGEHVWCSRHWTNVVAILKISQPFWNIMFRHKTMNVVFYKFHEMLYITHLYWMFSCTVITNAKIKNA